MKKILMVVFGLFTIIILSVCSTTGQAIAENVNIHITQKQLNNVFSPNNVDPMEIIEQKLIEQKQHQHQLVDSVLKNVQDDQNDYMLQVGEEEYLYHLNILSETQDKKIWFIEYKNILNQYSMFLDKPQTIYDCFTEEELDLFFRVVQAEIGDEYSFNQKCNVASVIFNRVESELFEDTLLDVLSYDQFASISDGRYKKVEVSETTILACEYAFEIESTTDALFFDSSRKLKYKYLFNDGAHNFYTVSKEGD